MRIFYAVKQNDKGLLAAHLSVFQNIRKLRIFNARDLGNDSLMVAAFAVMTERHAYLIQLCALDLTDNEVSFMCKRNDLAKRTVMLLHHKYSVDASSALNGFLDRISSHYDVRKLHLRIFSIDYLSGCGTRCFIIRPVRKAIIRPIASVLTISAVAEIPII